MKYKIQEKEAFTIVGLKHFGNNANNEIHGLWNNFGPRMHEVSNRVNMEIAYGYDTWTDQINTDGKFTYFACVQVADDSCVPDGMEIIHVPANKYAIFEIEKTTPNFDKVIQSIFSEILPKEGLELNGDYDFEMSEREGPIHFHVPIK